MAGVLWVHICPSVVGPLVFLFQDDYLNEYQCFSPNLVCALILYRSGPSCSKLTTSFVNDSLKFTLSDTQIC